MPYYTENDLRENKSAKGSSCISQFSPFVRQNFIIQSAGRIRLLVETIYVLSGFFGIATLSISIKVSIISIQLPRKAISSSNYNPHCDWLKQTALRYKIFAALVQPIMGELQVEWDWPTTLPVTLRRTLLCVVFLTWDRILSLLV